MADIMFAGIGGQGVLTAGKILIQIAAENGKNVSWTSEYSAEMRGGIALCRVVVYSLVQLTFLPFSAARRAGMTGLQVSHLTC